MTISSLKLDLGTWAKNLNSTIQGETAPIILASFTI